MSNEACRPTGIPRATRNERLRETSDIHQASDERRSKSDERGSAGTAVARFFDKCGTENSAIIDTCLGYPP